MIEKKTLTKAAVLCAVLATAATALIAPGMASARGHHVRYHHHHHMRVVHHRHMMHHRHHR